jgi:hypothetical protein
MVPVISGNPGQEVLMDLKRILASLGTGSDDDPILPADKVRSLEIRIGNATLIANPHDPADILAAKDVARALMAPHLASSLPVVTSDPGRKRVALPEGSPSHQADPLVTSAASPVRNLAGQTLTELISRYATRKQSANHAKTNYEYEKMQRKFEQWVHTKKRLNPCPVRLITRADVSDFIDDLIADGVSPQTIQKKYLSALNGLFVLAQTSGVVGAGVDPPLFAGEVAVLH